MSVNIITIGDGFHGGGAAEFNALLGQEAACCDILEGLTETALRDIGPRPGAPVFMTRSPFTGEEIALAKSSVASRLDHFLRDRAARPDELDLLWCTGRFDLQSKPNNLLFPADIVLSAVRNMLRDGVLGVLMPLADQRAQMEAKWRGQGFEAVTAPVLPGAPVELFEDAARELVKSRPALVVMDCMIYDSFAKQRVRQIVGAPVLLSSTICARVMGEFV